MVIPHTAAANSQKCMYNKEMRRGDGIRHEQQREQQSFRRRPPLQTHEHPLHLTPVTYAVRCFRAQTHSEGLWHYIYCSIAFLPPHAASQASQKQSPLRDGCSSFPIARSAVAHNPSTPSAKPSVA
ncbi:hypothetical protein, unlikely [Trypanosoma brucei gambiense DAL972]|uniref:Uncharacterized protein n=1 Tax=Trypanosoma brucei gambiense (strain MHOM/CI/86/DAL972) TaxID=679716 RepID=C9ZKA5_TRYB9|nr:hypothetical protein, unlikely [Trypanosoma brucei gambiense DAL972]CBH09869.1 hypothetical protein, unlikely [Trypanosoma brucei gambiense DAL972]|eukprot:XP_011772162.1 hypothetical protein, unlikely [Trypanosoma brucei gambiense DAL972]